MTTIKVDDGTEIFYKDWGDRAATLFHHGWPLSADDWDSQMMFFLRHGYRVIAMIAVGTAAPPRRQTVMTWTPMLLT